MYGLAKGFEEKLQGYELQLLIDGNGVAPAPRLPTLRTIETGTLLGGPANDH